MEHAEKVKAEDACAAGVVMRPEVSERVEVHGRFSASCRDSEGRLKWYEGFENLVTTVGKNDLLDKYFAGSAYTAAVVMGLKGVGSANATDTQASHAGWLEQGLANAPTYTGNRPTPAFSAASAGSKATSSAVSFAITSTGTVGGVFINMSGSSTKDNTSGILYSAGDFSVARGVASGDTINVTWTASA